MECGGGIEIRDISCYFDGAPAEMNECDVASMPMESQDCNTHACPDYAWSAGSFLISTQLAFFSCFYDFIISFILCQVLGAVAVIHVGVRRPAP